MLLNFLLIDFGVCCFYAAPTCFNIKYTKSYNSKSKHIGPSDFIFTTRNILFYVLVLGIYNDRLANRIWKWIRYLIKRMCSQTNHVILCIFISAISFQWYNLFSLNSCHDGNWLRLQARNFFFLTLTILNHGGICSALTSYGAYIRPMPYANEIGLRMLIGGAVREAATRDMDVWPVFSYFARHGPVFRVMLRVRRGKPKENKYL